MTIATAIYVRTAELAWMASTRTSVNVLPISPALSATKTLTNAKSVLQSARIARLAPILLGKLIVILLLLVVVVVVVVEVVEVN